MPVEGKSGYLKLLFGPAIIGLPLAFGHDDELINLAWLNMQAVALLRSASLRSRGENNRAAKAALLTGESDRFDSADSGIAQRRRFQTRLSIPRLGCAAVDTTLSVPRVLDLYRIRYNSAVGLTWTEPCEQNTSNRVTVTRETNLVTV